MDIQPSNSPILDRPKFARWLWDRGIGNAEAGADLGVGRESIRRWCLPFADPLRVEPRRAEKEKVHAYTGGEIGPADWYPVHLSTARAERVPEDVQ